MNSASIIEAVDQAAVAFADAMTSPRPRAIPKAGLAACAFASVGIWCAMSVTDWAVSGPLVGSFGVLVLNTYFSVRRFAAVADLDEPAPSRRARHAIDAGLALTYALLASSFGSPTRFAAVATLLFALATLKYALLLGRTLETELLVRKIRVDAVGTIACASALWAMDAGHTMEACWGLAVVNVMFNVYLLWLRPLYR